MDIGRTLQIMADLLTNPMYWVVLIAAILLTGPLGLIPGVGSTTILAITLPFLVLNVDPLIGMVFVAGMLSLGNTMDIIPAVLLGYPSGTTAVDFLEGHQLTRRGLGARVVGASYSVSMIGGLIGAFALAFTMPMIKPLIVQFSYPEISAMAIFGIAMVAVLARGAALRAGGAALLGLLLSSIGIVPITGVERFTFDQAYLWDKLPLVPVLLGILALPEIVDLLMSGQPIAKGGQVSNREVWIGFKEGLQRWKIIPRQSLFGVFLGSIPGVGGATIEWLSYALGIAFSKDKSQFGKGSLDGILFTESAQSAKEAGQAIPTLAFGIPGGSGWALGLAALIAYGIAPGLGMLDRHLDITMGIVLTIGLGNLLGATMALFITAQVAKLTLVPYPFVAGMIIPLMFLGAFQTRNQFGDIAVLLAMGSLGLAMKWFGWPRPPLILAFVLGPVLERNAWTALGVNGPMSFFTRPMAVGILVFAVATAIYLIWMMRQGEARMAAALEDEGVDGPVPAGASPAPAAPAAVAPARRGLTLAYRWRWEHLFWLVLLAWVGGVVLRESLEYTGATQFFPMWASLIFLAILTTLVVRDVFKAHERGGGVLDLGMRTGTDTAAFRALLPVVGWLGLFMFLMGTIGLQITSVIFPAIFILANTPLKGRERLWVLVPVGLSALVSYGLLENVMHVIWPEPFLWNAVFGRR